MFDFVWKRGRICYISEFDESVIYKNNETVGIEKELLKVLMPADE